MVHSPAFTFSSVYPLGFLPRAGLRLWLQRQFSVFFQHCVAFVAQCFFAVCTRRQAGVSRSGVWV